MYKRQEEIREVPKKSHTAEFGVKKERTQSELQRSKFVLSFLRETFLPGIHFPLTIIQCINRSVDVYKRQFCNIPGLYRINWFLVDIHILILSQLLQ